MRLVVLLLLFAALCRGSFWLSSPGGGPGVRVDFHTAGPGEIPRVTRVVVCEAAPGLEYRSWEAARTGCETPGFRPVELLSRDGRRHPGLLEPSARALVLNTQTLRVSSNVLYTQVWAEVGGREQHAELRIPVEPSPVYEARREPSGWSPAVLAAAAPVGLAVVGLFFVVAIARRPRRRAVSTATEIAIELGDMRE